MKSQVPTLTRMTHRIRYHQILTVFVRHGSSSVIKKTTKPPYLTGKLWEKPDAISVMTLAEHFGLALEELGPTFVKIGQFLTTRPDMLEPEFIQELPKL